MAEIPCHAKLSRAYKINTEIHFTNDFLLTRLLFETSCYFVIRTKLLLFNKTHALRQLVSV